VVALSTATREIIKISTFPKRVSPKMFYLIQVMEDLFSQREAFERKLRMTFNFLEEIFNACIKNIFIAFSSDFKYFFSRTL